MELTRSIISWELKNNEEYSYFVESMESVIHQVFFNPNPPILLDRISRRRCGSHPNNGTNQQSEGWVQTVDSRLYPNSAGHTGIPHSVLIIIVLGPNPSRGGERRLADNSIVVSAGTLWYPLLKTWINLTIKQTPRRRRLFWWSNEILRILVVVVTVV